MHEQSEPEGGDAARLIPEAYTELRRIARQHVARLKPGQTLTPTDLVHEALQRLLRQKGRVYNDTYHLICVAARAMHNVLVDLARKRCSAKRGGMAKRVKMEDDFPIAAPAEDMLGFHEACEDLNRRSPSHFELVLLHLYAGLTLAEIAKQRKQSTRTVERHWKIAKAVLTARMGAALKGRLDDEKTEEKRE